MKRKNWSTPPILEIALKLQKIHQKLRQAEIKGKLERAQKLLQQHLNLAKKKLNG